MANVVYTGVEEAFDGNDVGQLWMRLQPADDPGYFILLNPKSGKFLHGFNPPNTLTIEGTTSFFVYFFYQSIRYFG